MTNQKKVWNKHRITAIAIILIALAFAFSIYMELDNPAINHPKSLEKSISNYIFTTDVQAKVVQADKRDGHLFVTFKDERYPNFMGIAIFQREADLFWHPVNASYGNELSVATYHYYSNEYIYDEANNSYYPDKMIAVIYGVNVDPRIAYYEGRHPGQEDFYKNNITSSNFIDYYEGELYVYDLDLLDKDGNNIKLDLKMEADNSGPGGFISSSRSVFGNIWVYFIILVMASAIASLFWDGNPNPIRGLKKEEEAEKTKTPMGFMNKLKNLEKKKKTALIVLMIALVASVTLHSVFYSTFTSEDALTKAIGEATGNSNVTLLKTETEGNYLIALYTTEEPYLRGVVIFERGWIGLVAAIEYNEKKDICISYHWNNFLLGDEYYLIVTGIDCDPRAVSYECIYEYADIDRAPITVYSNDISEPNFVHIYKMENRYPTKLKIYDAEGNNIEPELSQKAGDENSEIGSGQGASHGMFYEKAIPILILLIGILCGWWLWIGKERQQE